MEQDPEPHQMWLLPPAAGLCAECGARHGPEAPHNAVSLYYQLEWLMRHGRAPTWADAAAHCPPEVQEAVRQTITEMGLQWD